MGGEKKFVGTYIIGRFSLTKAYLPNGKEMMKGNSGEWFGYTDTLMRAFQKGTFVDGFKDGEWEILNTETGKAVARVHFK